MVAPAWGDNFQTAGIIDGKADGRAAVARGVAEGDAAVRKDADIRIGGPVEGEGEGEVDADSSVVRVYAVPF